MVSFQALAQGQVYGGLPENPCPTGLCRSKQSVTLVWVSEALCVSTLSNAGAELASVLPSVSGLRWFWDPGFILDWSLWCGTAFGTEIFFTPQRAKDKPWGAS